MSVKEAAIQLLRDAGGAPFDKALCARYQLTTQALMAEGITHGLKLETRTIRGAFSRHGKPWRFCFALGKDSRAAG